MLEQAISIRLFELSKSTKKGLAIGALAGGLPVAVGAFKFAGSRLANPDDPEYGYSPERIERIKSFSPTQKKLIQTGVSGAAALPSAAAGAAGGGLAGLISDKTKNKRK